jgi:DNA-binding CsgD family transcriptional regulator
MPVARDLELKLEAQITAAIAARADVETIFDIILHAATLLCDAPIAALALLTPEQELVVTAVHGTNAAIVGEHLPPLRPRTAEVLAAGRSLRTRDASGDRRPLVRTIAERTGARGGVLTPVPGGDGFLGVLCVARRCRWECTDPAVLKRLAATASIAVQNAMLRSCPVPGLLASPPSPTAAARRARGGEDHGPDLGRRLHLSPRERQIMQLLVGGKTYKEAAAALDISPRTVEHYVERMKKRFHQSRLPALTGKLAVLGLLPPA